MNPRTALTVTGYVLGLLGLLTSGLILFAAMGADASDPNDWTLAESVVQATLVLVAGGIAWLGLTAAGNSYPRKNEEENR